MTEQETVKNLIMSGKAAKNRADGGEAVPAQTSGDMPRNKQFGYLFTGTINDANTTMSKADIVGRTVAHELGHGRYIIHKVTIDKDSILILEFDCNTKKMKSL
jgi:hypothetical protein